MSPTQSNCVLNVPTQSNCVVHMDINTIELCDVDRHTIQLHYKRNPFEFSYVAIDGEFGNSGDVCVFSKDQKFKPSKSKVTG